MAAEAAGLPTGNDALPAPEDAGKGTSARHWEKGKGRVAPALRMRPHGRRRLAGSGTADGGEAGLRAMGGASQRSAEVSVCAVDRSVLRSPRLQAPGWPRTARRQLGDKIGIGEMTWPQGLSYLRRSFSDGSSSSSLPGPPTALVFIDSFSKQSY